MKKRLFALLLLVVMVFGLLPVPGHAATVYYFQTNKANVPIWTQASSGSTQYRVIGSANTVLKVVASTKNAAGNLWYQLTDGTWVYSGNVSSHTHSYFGGICSNSTCRYEYPYSVSGYSATVEVCNTAGAKIWSRPYSNNSTHMRTAAYGSVLSIIGKTTNIGSDGKPDNLWYKLSDGSWVFSGNVTTHYHSYFGGICTKCKYEPSLTVTSISGNFAVTNTEGAKIWSRPYSNNSTHKRTAAYGSVLTIIAKTTNIGADGKPDNLWYKLSDGTWVYSGNVTQRFVVQYSANGGQNPPAAQAFLSGKTGTLSSAKPTRTGYLFQGWSTSSSASSASYKAGASYSATKDITLYAVWSKCSSHTYKGGICTKCNYEAPLTITSISGSFAVTNTEGAKIWSRPYSNNSTHMRTAAYGSVLTIVAQTTNIGSDGKPDNLWYQLSDGTWVYSGNVAKQLTLKYHSNGSMDYIAPQTFLSGKTFNISSTKLTRIGYNFRGWATFATASKVEYAPGASFTATKDTTLYAVWTQCSHSYVGGICSKCNYEPKLDIISCSGTFVVTNKDGASIWSRPYSNNSTKIKVAKYNTALKVVAKTTNIGSDGKPDNLWYKLDNGNWVYSGNVKQQITLTYHPMDGSNGPKAQTFLAGKNITISSTKPTKVGYTFKGWSTDSEATKATYKAGDSFTAKKNTTLYAVWAKCSHTYVGGICSKCTYEAPLTITSSSGTYIVTNKDGASIWSRPYSNNSSKIKVAKYNTALKVVAKTTNVGSDGKPDNLWYQLDNGNWVYSGNVAKQITVKYNANGGQNPPASKTFPAGQSISLSSTKPTKVGYTFKGWSTDSDATKATYKAGGSFTANKNTTLYAVWAKCSHTYVGGICSKCTYEAPLTITSYSATFVVTNKDGASIWSRPYSNNSSKIKVAKYNTALKVVAKTTNVGSDGKPDNLWYQLDNGNWVYSGNVTRQVTVKYNANGGQNPPASKSYLVGKTISLSSSVPTRTGYVFKGWSTSSSASSATYKAGASYTVTKDITLYAVWRKCSSHTYNGGICTKCSYEAPLTITSFSATFVVTNEDGASVWSRPYSNNSTKVKTASYKTALKVVAKTTNIGSNGKPDNLWYQLEDGNWVYSANVTRQYTVKYHANGGQDAPSSQTFLSGKSVKITSAKPNRPGYIFKGWATSADSTTVSYQAKATYSTKKNLTLYAVWSKCSSHTYAGGICSKCQYEAPLTITSFTGTFAVTNKDGAAIWSRPYSSNSTKIQVASYNTTLKVVAKTTPVGSSNLWYQLDNGNWVYSGNVTRQYTIQYKANGGANAPKKQTYLSGKTVTISSTEPTRQGYTFQGWATSSSSSQVTYTAGGKYTIKKDLTLYAVWQQCNHDYSNNYGICNGTNCTAEYPLELNSIDIVCVVDNADGAYTYQRPYAKSSEKVTMLSNQTTISLVNETLNADGVRWYQLNDGSWIKASQVQMANILNNIEDITPSYYSILLEAVENNQVRNESIGGVSYYYFFNEEKGCYLKMSAFIADSNNTQLDKANQALANAVNERTSTTEKFIYNKQTTTTVKAGSNLCSHNNSETHKHIKWDLTALIAKAGISEANELYIRCQNEDNRISLEYCTDANEICKATTSAAKVYPIFTVEAIPETAAFDAIGWLDSFELTGKGLGEQSLALNEYVDLCSAAIHNGVVVNELVVAPTPQDIYETISDGWSFFSEIDSATESTDFSSGGKENLDYSTRTAEYHTYKMQITSPIMLQSANDYLEAHISFYRLNSSQVLSVNLSIK